MRIASLCVAALLAAAGVVHAATPAAAGLDFPKQTFTGGNVNPVWRVELKRVEAGAVELRLSSPRGVPIAAGTLKSVEPVLKLPVFGELKGQYGLAGPVILQQRSLPAQVLVAPSKAGRPCQDASGKKYSQAVFLVIGASSDPDKLYYGCGEYAKP
ncbi:hypothetical protein ACI2IY_08205 [Lysobacter enzymogenes]|uniref:hypothetical protein n=1 Tax=Lysobacter enzymogenes TaxID=69 RepID=UPI00384C93A2